MAISFDKQNKIFKLDTNNSSYILCVSDYDILEHLYYGEKIVDTMIKEICNRQIYSFTAQFNKEDRKFVTSTALSEFSPFGCGDFRNPDLILDGANCSRVFKYKSHKIYKGKCEIKGMPSSRDMGNVETLEIELKNDDETLLLKLFYSVYEKENIIARHTELTNLKLDKINILKIASANVDFFDSDFSLATLEGMYLAERSGLNKRKIVKGIQGNYSVVGQTSHQANPFFALLKGNADENNGEVYGFNLVYSSNFKNEIEVDRLGQTRVISGINENGFNWGLKNSETFTTPECIMTYSNEGLSGMSRNFHDHIRNNIIEEKYKEQIRPIVINTWEASYFNVNENIVMSLAEKCQQAGIDTVVLDDGWFRDTINEGLADWKTIKSKFSSLKNLSEKIHKMGLKFGIWIEPEMVAVDSEYLKKNSQSILSVEKTPFISRNQYFLDLTDDKNIDYIVNRLKEELGDVEIDYIKWDCNRYAVDAGSKNYNYGEVYHRQVLGLYKLFDKITSLFSNAMFENCSGGGGRFDLGMLYYSPQIWASDNTDPYERLYIQYGTSIAYPTSSISCHFSKGICTSGRPSTYDFRYKVASMGAYGYELDLTQYKDEELAEFKKYSDEYRSIAKFSMNADIYRLMSPESDTFCAYMQVTKDKSEALLYFYEINTRGLTESMVLHLEGLDDNTMYMHETWGLVMSGRAWKKVGLRVTNLFAEKGGSGRLIKFIAVK